MAFGERLIRVYEPDAVTSTEGGLPEVEPAAAGLTGENVARIWSAVTDVYRSGLYPAMAITLRRRGKVVLDRAIGHARGNSPAGDTPGGNPGGDPDSNADAALVQATPRTLFTLFSASKMVTAMLVHLLAERGTLGLDDPVARYIPEFARHGKDAITLRHVLTHRAGIPHVPPQYANLDTLGSPEIILEALCAAKPTWAPGRRLAYHALTGGYVLAEVIKRAAGTDVRTLLGEILAPLGFAHFNYGVAAHDMEKVAENAFTGVRVPRPAAGLLKRALGVDFMDAARLSNDPRFLQAVVPAGNIIGTAEETCRFMELLLRGGTLDGVRVFDRRTIARAVREQAYLEVDLTLGAPVRYSMGFILGSNYASIYGYKTRQLFGHLGFTNVVAYADPQRDISLGLMTSGKPFVTPGLWRWLKLMQVIARVCPRDHGE
jgi:CubicO group peptidase (beta-lactamase class C family)